MTGMQFRPRQEAWRGRGRPPDPVPQDLLDALRRTVETGECVTVPLDGDVTEAEIAAFKKKIRNGCRQLRLSPRIQEDDTELRFYAARIQPRGNRNVRPATDGV